MDQIYLIMLVALFVLAIIDLVVGVSNDAVNFLNAAIGSKAAPIKAIMIVASVGIIIGAVSSSGMMEVARKGIFNPEQFYFNEIMIIFMAVMISDILLLDLFNSLGLPTSTTVSIVFELLGAAVSISLLKIYADGGSVTDLLNYINTSKAAQIIFGILLSVVIAFSVGAFIQYISRLIFSFRYHKNLQLYGGVFGGVAITALTYFILIKGLKGVSFISPETLGWIDAHQLEIISLGFLFWTIISYFFIMVMKWNILKVIILIGTFALALAFAGNDLVNFIGVPIAAWQSFQLWVDSGMNPELFSMATLSGKVKTPSVFLFLAGLVMVVTLWLSKKAKTVTETEINLSSQDDVNERFEPNFLSRLMVRAAVNFNQVLIFILPKKMSRFIASRFEKPISKKAKGEDQEPAFDMVRASVNLVVAGILIAIGTSLKLPLSTTYVTFMVAMGSSLSDKAWGRESAVYRVAGVFNVIGGWFATAIIAFIAAAVFAFVMFKGGVLALIALLLLATLVLIRSYSVYKRKIKEREAARKFDRSDLITINEIITESSGNISEVIIKLNRLYSNVIDNLGLQDLSKLKKNKKNLRKLENEIDDLKGDLFYFIKSLDDNSVASSKFYILVLDYLQDMVQSIGYIVKNSFSHVNNNHKNLKFNQIRDLKSIDNKLKPLFEQIELDFNTESFDNIENVIEGKKELLDHVSQLIQKQIDRIRSTETSPKNTKLYFGLLLETKDLISASINLLQLFNEFNEDYKTIKK
ncbi:inorganic phosphate transporter [Zhouia amylolytica]|uniref:Phosphate transporter n=1 Tax=Zhouia amylolytica AD3 TaxID=1286632 RepID=W2ULQ5_9FLAO|nr:inorganic phosphate transporter [Zhouia amylolytica]ETN94361.1 putative phosphate permease [Zhouia amylolytica AD3]